MDWLRGHMRDQIHDNMASIDSSENVLNFTGRACRSPRYDPTAALDLVGQAAEAFRSIQDRADETEARARSLARKAVENLQLAEARVQAAETARRAAEEELRKMSARLADAENELGRNVSRIASAEAQLGSAEEQVRAIEARAIRAEQAFKQLEQAIRKQLLGLESRLNTRSASAA
jgi:chromosome segregation ATPase